MIIPGTVTELSAALQKGEISAREAVSACLTHIEQNDGDIGAWLTLRPEEALKEADEIDRLRAKGEKLPPLAGVPCGIKDNICTKGLKTTCASKMLDQFIPPYDADVVERLRAQRVICLGKLNMDEFAMGSSTENSAVHPTKNPCDLTRVPGGSSGGSAAAVAAWDVPFTIGSDTGGSIRQPAAFCGVVGMKPTYGLVSRYGLIAFASSLDQIGPLTGTVEDNALILSVLAGHDPRDATSLPDAAAPLSPEMMEGIKGMKFALPKEYFSDALQPEIADTLRQTVRRLEVLGAEVDEVSLPHIGDALPAYYVISSAEASSNLGRFDGVRYGFRASGVKDMQDLYRTTRTQGFGPEVRRRILLGSFVLSAGYYDAYYKKALAVRALIIREFNDIFQKYDVILAPTAPTTAYKLGEKTADPMEMYLGDIYTVPVNIAGLPALDLPCGEDNQGLPIGLQLIGKPRSEATLYQAGWALEQDRARGGDVE